MFPSDDNIPLSDCVIARRTTTLNEELGQIEYIFSDKVVLRDNV